MVCATGALPPCCSRVRFGGRWFRLGILMAADTSISPAFSIRAGKLTAPVEGEKCGSPCLTTTFSGRRVICLIICSQRVERAAPIGPKHVFIVTTTSKSSPALTVRELLPAPAPPAWRSPHRTTTSLLCNGKSCSSSSKGSVRIRCLLPSGASFKPGSDCGRFLLSVGASPWSAADNAAMPPLARLIFALSFALPACSLFFPLSC
mmetsp:Transcript_102131/g.164609  ORF Transcript_102131/g.164609 Transcript_102131/m.164609 type:complete len:205 (+) Transcript_102131:230-844(+)